MEQISKIGLLIIVVGFLFMAISGNLLSRSPFVIAGQLLAVALSFWARRSFQRGQFSIQAKPAQGPLLSSGPYRWIRHPMYASALLLFWSSILGHLSLLTAIIGLIAISIIAIRMGIEERFLRERYPDYRAYARKTKRLIPFIL